MRAIGPATEDEMILAFLRAEIHSPRFKPLIRKALGGDASIIYTARLDDPAENAARKAALQLVRGYGANAYLFGGFPANVEWQRVAVTPAEVGSFLYAKHATWLTLSGGTRLVSDGAANVETVPTTEDSNANIIGVEREIASGRTYPELIAAAEAPDRQHVLVEGHTRATAYVRALPHDAEIEVIVGYSPEMPGWSFY